MPQDTERIEHLVLVRETEKARLCRDEDLPPHELDTDPPDANHWWFPRSQTTDTNLNMPGDRGYIVVRQWLLSKKGMSQ